MNPLKVWTNLFALVLILATFSSNALQRDPNDPWWFEVEAIVFERGVSPNEINEVFDLQIIPIETQNLESFIFATLQPDISLLQQSHRTCGLPEKTVNFPKQTAPAPLFDQRLIEASHSELLDSEETALNERPLFDQTILAQANLNNVEFIVENRPSLKLLKIIEAPFTGFEQELTKRIDTQLSQSLAPRYQMFDAVHEDDEKHLSIPDTLLCQWPAEKSLFVTEENQFLQNSQFLKATPTILDGIEYPYSDVAYTLPSESLQLTSLKRSIQRQRGLNVLLHMAWRQDVKIGRDNAPWYRLTAGVNHSQDYVYTGIAKNQLPQEPLDAQGEEQDIVAKIVKILSEPEYENENENNKASMPLTFQQLANSELNEQFKEVWALDGRLKVFIEYIGGTPYLHIDSELNYRVPTFVDWQALDGPTSPLIAEEQPNNTDIAPSPNMLQPIHFEQLRRVISNEIHYFDHPMFGMVFQIRRYNRPDPPEPEALALDQASVR